MNIVGRAVLPERKVDPMSTYAWMITHVNTKELGEDMVDEIGIAGPRDATEEQLLALKGGAGYTFRMVDGDGIWCYRGRLVIDGAEAPVARITTLNPGEKPIAIVCSGLGDDQESFGPLDDFGRPNCGCVDIQFRCDDPTTIDGGQPAKVWASL